MSSVSQRRNPRLKVRADTIDGTPTSRSISSTRNQFKATTMWNNISSIFVDEGPRKKVRRQFRKKHIENVFTGREGVDFLMKTIPEVMLNGRTVTRTNCSNLLQKFMDNGIISKFPATSKQEFKDDDSLFVQNSMPTIAKPKLIADGEEMGDEDFPARSQTPDFLKYKSPENCKFDRRTSMSHGDLSTLTERVQKADRALDFPHSIKEDMVYINQKTPPVPVIPPPKASEAEAGCSENYVWLSFGKQKTEKTTPVIPSYDNLRRQPIRGSYRRRVNSACTSDYSSHLSSHSEESKTTRSAVITDQQVWNIWKSGLLNKFSSELNVEATSIINWDISGYDIQQNVEMFHKGAKGKNDFSGYLQKMMKYLEQFPFSTGNSNVMIYKDNQEINVFKTVCSNLTREPPILTTAESLSLLAIYSLLHERLTTKQGRISRNTSLSQMRNKSRMAVTPLQRNNQSTATTPVTEFSGKPYYPPSIKVNGISNDVQIVFSSDDMDSFNDVSKENRRPLSRSSLLDSDPRDLLSLPGLKRSPVLMAKINEMCSPTQSNNSDVMTSSYITARTQSPALHKFPLGVLDTLTSCFSLILLTIPNKRLRKLLHLVRFMNKIASNHCLQLDPEANNNRSVVLESLCMCIVPDTLSPFQTMDIVCMLMDSERSIFAVDPGFRSDVIRLIEHSKIKIVNDTSEEVLNQLSTPPTNVIQYCDKIELEDYGAQLNHQDEFLISLLDQIVIDKNLKENDRRKKLRNFQKMYPEVYKLKFPEVSPKEERGFLRKLLHY